MHNVVYTSVNAVHDMCTVNNKTFVAHYGYFTIFNAHTPVSFYTFHSVR